MEVPWALRILAAAALSLLALGGWARAASVPGVTDTEIVIGITGPLTGPAAAWGSFAQASEAYAAHVNAQGGVHGRKLKIVLKDDGYNPGRAVANFNELKDSVFAVIGTVGTAVLNANKDLVAEAKLPLVYPLGNVQVFARQPRERVKTVFQVYPDHADEAEFLVGQAAALEKVKKLALFGQNDDYGKQGLEGAKRALPGNPGVFIVGEVVYEVTDRELATQADKLKESGAEAVLLYATPVHAANIVKEMAKIGYRPKIFASFTLCDRDTMFRLLADVWENVYFSSAIALRGEPAADKVIDVIILVEGLKRAGRDLTREKFVAALETIKDFDEGGLVPGVTFGPDRHHGLNAVRLMRTGKASDLPKQVTPWKDHRRAPRGPAQEGHHRARRRAHRAAAAGVGGRRRRGLRARGPRPLPRAHRGREPRPRHKGAPPPRGPRGPGAGPLHVPPAPRAHPAAGRHAPRRRAADAGHRPRAAATSPAPAPRRAVAGAHARDVAHRLRRAGAPPQGARHLAPGLLVHLRRERPQGGGQPRRLRAAPPGERGGARREPPGVALRLAGHHGRRRRHHRHLPHLVHRPDPLPARPLRRAGDLRGERGAAGEGPAHPAPDQVERMVVWDPKGLWGFDDPRVVFHDDFQREGDALRAAQPGRLDEVLAGLWMKTRLYVRLWPFR